VFWENPTIFCRFDSVDGCYILEAQSFPDFVICHCKIIKLSLWKCLKLWRLLYW